MDDRLAVEWSDSDGMELIISTNGKPAAFSMAKAVAAGLKADGWRVIGLKPARGFGFSLDVERGQLDASRLKFDPMRADAAPDSIGIQVFVPEEAIAIPDLLDALWLVIETGIGEEACAEIEHLEAAPLDEAPEGALPISDLARFIDWKVRKRAH